MSLETDGTWAGGVWAPTVWESGVWREGGVPELMAHVSDEMHNKLTGILLHDGQLNDLMVEWLQTLDVSVTSDQIEDAWHQYWDTIITPAVIPAGDFNDRAYAWLGGLGYTGSLDDRWYSFWSAP